MVKQTKKILLKNQEPVKRLGHIITKIPLEIEDIIDIVQEYGMVDRQDYERVMEQLEAVKIQIGKRKAEQLN